MRLKKAYLNILLFLLTFFSCSGRNSNQVVQLYLENKNDLNKIVNMVVKEKLFTRISIENSNILEEDKLNKNINVLIEKNNFKTYSSCYIAEKLTKDDFKKVSMTYLLKCNNSKDSVAILQLTDVLAFLYNMHIEGVSISAGYENNVKFMTGFESCLCFLYDPREDFRKVIPIEGYWNYCEYK